MPKISIIVPCYNQANFLPETVQSICDQSLADWELILVDDGSTDQTPQLIDSYAASDTRILSFHKPNGGTASTIHYGLLQATGEYINIIGSDDLLSPDMLEKQIDFMETNQLLVSYSGYYHFTDDEQGQRTITYPQPWTTYTLLSFHFSLLTRWGIDYSFPAHCFIYNRQFLIDNGLDYNIPVRQREDWYFHLMISSLTSRIQGNPQLIGAGYRHHAKGKTGSYIKVVDGNFKFLFYMAQLVHDIDILLLSYRLSAEFWLTIGRCIKYRSLACLKHITGFNNTKSIFIIILALILLPISLLIILSRSIYIYTCRKF